MGGHIWTAFLNPIDRTPISSTLFLTTLLSLFFHPKPLPYLSHSPLILILMLLSSAVTFIPTLAQQTPALSAPVESPGEHKSVQCTNCSLWVHLSCSGLSPAEFRKISPVHCWTCPMCPSSSKPPPSYILTLYSSINTPNIPPSLTNTHKTISSKMNSPPQNNHE